MPYVSILKLLIFQSIVLKFEFLFTYLLLAYDKSYSTAVMSSPRHFPLLHRS